MALPRTTFILIIVVSAAVATALILLVLHRCFRYHAPPSTPLPPKQELARYREQAAPYALSTPSSQFASKSSLMSPERQSVRQPSFIMSVEEISQLTGTPELQLPQLPFDTSRTSLSTSESSPSDSSLSHPQSRSPSSTTRPHRRGRPLSVGSTSSSAISRNAGRHQGPPHGPFSQVQIVLPAPLALTESSSRLSVVDQWAPRVVRSEQRRSSSSSEPRKSTSLSLPPINAWHTQRAASASSDYTASPPPVPRIPEQWNALSRSVLDRSEHGRSGEIPPPPVDPPPPHEGQRRLQRRSRSKTAV